MGLTWTYQAATKTMKLYVDGTLLQTCTGLTVSPSQMAAPSDMWLGKSGYLADPYLNARYRDFRVWSTTLA
jgi:hypothetical protein